MSGNPEIRLADLHLRQAGQLPDEEVKAFLRKWEPLIRAEVRRKTALLEKHQIDQDDALQTARIAAVESITRYDPEASSMSTYLRRQVGWALGNLVRDHKWGPGALAEFAMKLPRVLAEFDDKPTNEQIAESMGLSVERTALFLELLSRRIDSLDAPLGDEDGDTLHELLAGDGDSVDERLDEQEQAARAWALVGRLNKRDRRVFQLYYGDGLTMQQVGDELGLSRERVRQLMHAALVKLRRRARMQDWGMTETERRTTAMPKKTTDRPDLVAMAEAILIHAPYLRTPPTVERLQVACAAKGFEVANDPAMKAVRDARLAIGVKAVGRSMKVDRPAYEAACARLGVEPDPKLPATASPTRKKRQRRRRKPARLCKVPDCDAVMKARERCKRHWSRADRGGWLDEDPAGDEARYAARKATRSATPTPTPTATRTPTRTPTPKPPDDWSRFHEALDEVVALGRALGLVRLHVEGDEVTATWSRRCP